MDLLRSPRTGRLRTWVNDHALECGSGFGGALVAAILLGPGLGRGALINLDQVILPRVSMPDSIAGTGPQLPRRAPFTAIVSAFAPLGMSDIAAKLLIVAMFAAAAIGMARLCRRRGTPIAVGVGVMYVASPFLLTRVVVGHLGIVWAAAWLPWMLAEVCRIRPRTRRVLWMAVAVACGGYLAGSLALLVAVSVLIARFGRVGWSLCWRIVVAQAVWLVPGAAIASVVRFNQPSGADFGTRLAWPSALLRLLEGDGFFHSEAQAPAPSGVIGLVLGALILVLAVVGVIGRSGHRWGVSSAGVERAIGVAGDSARSDRSARTGRIGLVIGVVLLIAGLSLSLASISPGLKGIWPDLTAEMPFSLFREGQRAFLVAWIVLCPAVGWGLAIVAGRWTWAGPLTGVVPIAVALIFLGPSAWGAGDQLAPVQLPTAWESARVAIARDPGSTLVLPIAQYFREPAAGARRSHQLFPYYVGGDVIFSSDDGSEQVDPTAESWQQDPRVSSLLGAVSRWGFGRSELAPSIAEIGARYVVVLNAPGAQLYVPLFDEAGLRPVVETPSLVLLEVNESARAQVDAAALPRTTTELWPGLLRADSSPEGDAADRASSPWAGAAGRGWMSGTKSLPINRHGLAVVPEDAGWIWYWPAAVTQLVWAALALVGAVHLWSLRHRRRSATSH